MNPKESILIIDDDARNIFALAAVLRSRGIPVISALSARHGIEILQTNKDIKAVLLDMMMPEMDGYQAIQQIREISDLKKIPIVAVTAQAMVGDKERILNAGATQYISKPVDIDILMEVLNNFTDDYDR
jgi:two-component system, cell cycle response regulator DivK